MEPNVHLIWHGPFAFFRDYGVEYVFDSKVAQSSGGVYLWTIEHQGSHLINYIGKTSQAFAKRFGDELAYERSISIKVDVDLFLQGIRKKVPPHRDRIEEVLAAYRLFIAPLRSFTDSDLLRIEGSLMKTVQSAGEKYRQFLFESNKHNRQGFAGTLTMEPVNVLGLKGLLTDHIHE